ncbi:MAG: proprotein convertase P-domain-containing protein [Phycisphaerae bacterium]|nr:proprotein convertase P-domain-containing protein [Phycisphaerae bacterium]
MTSCVSKATIVAMCGVSLFAVSAANAAVYSGFGGAIPDSNSGNPGVVSYSITIEDNLTITGVNAITLKGLSHTWAGDLAITLTGPDATSVSLVNRVGVPNTPSGDSSNYNGDYAFADSGFSYGDGNLWTEASLGDTSYTIRSGTYAASGAGSGAAINLNALFAGKSLAGTWTLTISDNASFDTGSLGEWCLDVAVVPAPGAAALFALVGLGGRRRRAA